jgi:hypothetical protein
LKTSDDLELYEIDPQIMEDFNKDKLEEICDLRQPMVFSLHEVSGQLNKVINRAHLQSQYRSFDMKICDNKTQTPSLPQKETEEATADESVPVTLSYHATIDLLDKDEKSVYRSEHNDEFLLETGLRKQIQSFDGFLRPYMVSNCAYDVMLGADKAATPFRYELHYRNYFMVTEGTVKVKLAPPKYGKFLNRVKDYENFEFRSDLDVWKQDADYEKIKFLEVTLVPGQILFIPAYWWHSFQYTKGATMTALQYKTYMNNVALLPHYLMYVLQMQNIKRKIL